MLVSKQERARQAAWQAGDLARLQAWMAEHKINAFRLTQDTGLTHTYRMVKGEQPLSAAFREAFLRAYGRAAAEQVFPGYVAELEALLAAEAPWSQ